MIREAIITIWKAVLTLLAGTKTRKYEAGLRIRKFKQFLFQSRWELEKTKHTDDNAVWNKYEEIAKDLGGQYQLVREDFNSPERRELDRLVERASTWTPAEAIEMAKAETVEKGRNVDLRDILRDSIKAVWDFTKI